MVASLTSVSPTILALTEPTNFSQSIVHAEGFHAQENGFCWSSQHSTIIVKGQFDLYLSCGYLMPGEIRKVKIVEDQHLHEIILTAGIYIKLPIHCSSLKIIRFEADAFIIPKNINLNQDSRDLAFQLWHSPPLHEANKINRKTLLFLGVTDSKKEYDSIQPVFEELTNRGYHTCITSTEGALAQIQQHPSSLIFFVTSISGTYNKLVNAKYHGYYIYMEHGAAPLKKYTYLPHYQWYDLILLPGTLWVERISQLYPETKRHCRTVGYAKVKSPGKITAEKRAKFCQQFGFDASLPIVLFAPTWSDGDQERGIFNLNYFQTTNILTIPHDGDVPFAAEYQEKGHKIHCLNPDETISDYYHFADILVSDISSTAVEFAALGKPVICISTPRISDYDLNFKESDGRLRIPHTEYYWDFCQVVEREAISDVLKQIFKTKKLPQMTKTQQALVKKMITYIGEEAVSRSADAIIEFIRTVLEKSLYPKKQPHE